MNSKNHRIYPNLDFNPWLALTRSLREVLDVQVVVPGVHNGTVHFELKYVNPRDNEVQCIIVTGSITYQLFDHPKKG